MMEMNTEGGPPINSGNILDPDPKLQLSRVVAPTQLSRWLKQPNSAFDGSTPLQVIERGEADRIWLMLYDLESGQPG